MLQEMKIRSENVQDIAYRCWKGCVAMALDAKGNVDGLAIIWNPSKVIFQDWIAFPRILSRRFRYIGTKEMVFLTDVYGPHFPSMKEVFLLNLTTIRGQPLYHFWIARGDFNLIKSLGEKNEGIKRLDTMTKHFVYLLHDLHVTDLDTINGIYKWNNHRSGKHQVTSRLDLFLVS